MKRTVLLLDDDSTLRKLIAAPLEARGVEVLHASTGKRATEVLGERKVDLAVVDGLLPDTNGLEWIANSRLTHPELLIVFLSRFWKDMSSFEYLTTRLQVALVAHKPVHPTEFARQLGELLGDVNGEPRRAHPPSSGGATAARPTPRARVDSKLAQLSTEFKASLRDRLQELRSFLSEGATDAAAAEKARQLAHQLAGTSGSFGFRDAGRAMARIEEELGRFTARGTLHAETVSRARAIVDTISLDDLPADEAAAPGEGARGCVLVVDDDPLFLELVQAAARKYNIAVWLARSREEALAVATSRTIAAALIDVHLSDGLAFSLSEQLRALPSYAGLPLAFTSVDRSLETRLRAISAGGSAYLEKPVNENALLMLLTRLIQRPHPRAGRVLVVDDDAAFCKAVEAVLGAHDIEARSIVEPGRLIEALDKWPPDLILMDIYMPKISGLDLCRALRNSQRWRRTPILVVTAKHDLETRLAAFDAGADDLVAKPLAEAELLARIGVRLRQLRLAEEYEDHDSLTGLSLRRPFVAACEQMLGLASRSGETACIVLLDVDRFKAVNDRYGHLIGDSVLARLGRLLQVRLRAEDHRCRWGGEEFALAMPNQSIIAATRVVERVLHDFSVTTFVGDEGSSFTVDFSAGIAEFPTDGRKLEALIRTADQRLYEAKAQGRARVVGRAPGEGEDESVTR